MTKVKLSKQSSLRKHSLQPSHTLPPTNGIVAESVRKGSIHRPSTSLPALRRSDSSARPKRDIHPTPTKEMFHPDVQKKQRRLSNIRNDRGVSSRLRFCAKILADLNKRQYADIAFPFYEPVGKNQYSNSDVRNNLLLQIGLR